MRQTDNTKLVRWLLALAFLAVQAIAIAHELKHDLRQHNDASCVLHLHSKQAGGTATADASPSATFISLHLTVASNTTTPPSFHSIGYKSRAPPLSFDS